MLLGATCTRACRFCAVATGDPGGAVDWTEPERLVEAVTTLDLSHVVLTSVDRDDLEDGGAEVFATTIRRIKERLPSIRVEALVPDFSGDEEAIARVAGAGADVIGHNLEAVRRLTPAWRDHRASYELSLRVLSRFKALSAGCLLKSSLMLGLGENRTEVVASFRDLKEVGVDILTLGQYLRPTRHAAPVVRYLLPEEFDRLGLIAREMGFRFVFAGPLVRSSYHAASVFD
jgi:lipoic acid synthetase